MPKIRKKTSNRQNTRDRAKITRKVSEHTKKSKRDAKRNTTWKSKKKVDPGVPSSFHLKDQVLAEMAEQKRLAEEARLARKGGKPQPEEEEEENPGIIAVPAAVLTASAPLKAASASKAAQADEADADVPQLVDTHLSTLSDVLDRADVVLQVVDARDIQGGRSGFVEGLIRDASGNHGLIVNKADLVPREVLAAWLPVLPPQTFLFSSPPAAPSTSNKSKGPAAPVLPTLGREELLAAFKTWAAQKASAASTSSSSDELVVAFMGLPSVGKSSVINALLPSARVKQAVAPAVPSGASAKHPEPTTKSPVELRVQVGDAWVRVIDTPGWEYAEDYDDEEDEEDEAEDEEEEEEVEETMAEDEDEDEDAEGVLFDEEKAAQLDALEARVAGDLLRRNLGRVERVKDIFPLANYIITRSNAQDLMTCYNVPFFQEGDVEAFLTSLARSIGRVRKHGDADLEAAARHLVRDWSHNTFPYYTAAPKAAAKDMAVDGAETSDRPDMSKVLEGCRTKRELKATAKGLVRFKGGEVDEREVILDDDYTALHAPSDDEEEDDDQDEDDDGEEDDEEEEDEDDDEEQDGEDDDEAGSDVLEFDLVDGEELQLDDGPEPASPSSIEEEEEEEEELPAKKRRKTGRGSARR